MGSVWHTQDNLGPHGQDSLLRNIPLNHFIVSATCAAALILASPAAYADEEGEFSSVGTGGGVGVDEGTKNTISFSDLSVENTVTRDLEIQPDGIEDQGSVTSALTDRQSFEESDSSTFETDTAGIEVDAELDPTAVSVSVSSDAETNSETGSDRSSEAFASASLISSVFTAASGDILDIEINFSGGGGGDGGATSNAFSASATYLEVFLTAQSDNTKTILASTSFDLSFNGSSGGSGFGGPAEFVSVLFGTDLAAGDYTLGLGGTSTSTASVKMAARVPLPAAMPLLLSGIGAMSVVAWRRRKQADA